MHIENPIIPDTNIAWSRLIEKRRQGFAGGSYKNSDNVIAETDAEGHQKARFVPVPAFQTAEAMEELCARFLEAWEADRIDKLVLIPMFILDFLCIHPFNDGNGRMSLLLNIIWVLCWKHTMNSKAV